MSLCRQKLEPCKTRLMFSKWSCLHRWVYLPWFACQESLSLKSIHMQLGWHIRLVWRSSKWRKPRSQPDIIQKSPLYISIIINLDILIIIKQYEIERFHDRFHVGMPASKPIKSSHISIMWCLCSLQNPFQARCCCNYHIIPVHDMHINENSTVDFFRDFHKY